MLAMFSNYLHAQNSGVFVNPQRVLMHGEKASGRILIINQSPESRQFSLSFTEFRMEKNGTFTNIDEPDSGQFFASEVFQFSPAKFTLHSEDTQTVKFIKKSSEKLLQPEYRSHLTIQHTEVKDTTRQKKLGHGLAIQVNTALGITVPVIWRPEEALKTRVEISDVTGEKSGTELKNLQFTLVRTGPHSTYGNIVIWLDDGEKKTKIAMVNGLALYTPNSERQFTLPVSIDTNTAERLILRYTYMLNNDTSESAEKEFFLNNSEK